METIRLLVVDDEEGIREGCRRALRGMVVRLPYLEEDYALEVGTARDGEEALALIGQNDYDILLLDNKLPGMSGIDLLDRLAQNGREIIAIIITAFASLETAVTATRRGAYDFLTKPFSPDELRAAVHKAAKHRILTEITRRFSNEKKKVRFQFLSVLSHELKAPIAAVNGYLQLLRDHAAGNDLSAYDDIVTRAIERLDGMQKLIYDLLDLTRIESGEKKRMLSLVYPFAIARRCLETAKLEAERQNISLSLEGNEQTTMIADPAELEIIFNNLISNAIKYNRQNGSVTVTIAGDERTVTFTVRDTGIGIAPEHRDRLFKEFSRIRTKETAHITGSGLGLSIVWKIVHFYRGSVSLESVPGEGSTFRVILERGEISETHATEGQSGHVSRS